MAPFRILSLDGGGIRGLVTCQLLAKFNQQPGLAGFLDKVDLVAGTSTGGIIALALAAGVPLDNITNLYRTKGSRIFADSFFDDVWDIGKVRGAEYKNEHLISEVKDMLGSLKLKDLTTRVLIPTFDLDNQHVVPGKRQWKPKLFHNFPGLDSDGEELAWKVAVRTSAAPTYFPTYEGFADGGVYANNPAMCALAQALNPQSNAVSSLADIRLLSLGTGHSLTFIEGQQLDWGYIQWVKPLINLMMDGVMGIADYQCRQLLGGSYLRVEPVFPPGQAYKLDDVKHMERLDALVETYASLPADADWVRTVWLS